MVFNRQQVKMKEYLTESALHNVPEIESNTWVGKTAHLVLKEGNQEVTGTIVVVEKSARPNTPQSSDFLWVNVIINGKRYWIDAIKSLKILD